MALINYVTWEVIISKFKVSISRFGRSNVVSLQKDITSQILHYRHQRSQCKKKTYTNFQIIVIVSLSHCTPLCLTLGLWHLNYASHLAHLLHLACGRPALHLPRIFCPTVVSSAINSFTTLFIFKEYMYIHALL